MWKLLSSLMRWSSAAAGSPRVRPGTQVVWYLECRRVEDPQAPARPVERAASSMGSAVLVRLEQLRRDSASTQWTPFEPPRIERFLLTCAHVVADPAAASGVFDEIVAWAPGQDYRRWPGQAGPRPIDGSQGDLGGLRVQATPLGYVAGGQRAATDWVLLRFEDAAPAYVASLPAVGGYGTLDEGAHDVAICGYPGGAVDWSNGQTVRPLESGGFRVERHDDEQGHSVLAGADETRPGMSGGGVFLSDGTLVGLHRAALDRAMARYSVVAQGIFDWLEERGWRPPPRQARPETPWAILAALLLVLGGVLWTTLGPSGSDAERDKALAVALAERDAAKAQLSALQKAELQQKVDADPEAARPAPRGGFSTFWPNGKTLRIGFMDGSQARRDAFKTAVDEWMRYVNLTASYVSAGNAEIRVSFAEPESYSFMGIQSLVVEQDKPTLMRGVPSADATEQLAGDLHEFGHALGFMHEFQTTSGNRALNWNRINAENPGATDWVNQFLKTPSDVDPLYGSKPFDPESVMMYTFPADWFAPPLQITLKGKLSPGDIALARLAYPGRD